MPGCIRSILRRGRKRCGVGSSIYRCLITFAMICLPEFGGATWLLLYLMAKEAPPPAAVGYWSDTLRRFFRLGPLSLVIVLVTGVLRTVWYQPRQNRVKDRLLIIKHLLLGLVFLVGSLSQYWLAYGK